MEVKDQSNLQQFEFPKGITFDGTIFRTPEVCRIFKLKRDFLSPKFLRVRPVGIEPTSSIPKIDVLSIERRARIYY